MVHCSICKKQVGYAGFTPQKGWNMQGKLCSKCYGVALGKYRNISTDVKQQKTDSNDFTKESTMGTVQKSEILCRSCNKTNSEGSMYCNSCGSALQRKCQSCGFEPPVGSKFCNRCGTML